MLAIELESDYIDLILKFLEQQNALKMMIILCIKMSVLIVLVVYEGNNCLVCKESDCSVGDSSQQMKRHSTIKSSQSLFTPYL